MDHTLPNADASAARGAHRDAYQTARTGLRNLHHWTDSAWAIAELELRMAYAAGYGQGAEDAFARASETVDELTWPAQVQP